MTRPDGHDVHLVQRGREVPDEAVSVQMHNGELCTELHDRSRED
jgi:hypothetical protein